MLGLGQGTGDSRRLVYHGASRRSYPSGRNWVMRALRLPALPGVLFILAEVIGEVMRAANHPLDVRMIGSPLHDEPSGS